MKVTTVANDEVKDSGLDPEFLRHTAISYIANAVARGRINKPDFFEIDDVEDEAGECLGCKEIA